MNSTYRTETRLVKYKPERFRTSNAQPERDAVVWCACDSVNADERNSEA
jgi:hypothetical protein